MTNPSVIAGGLMFRARDPAALPRALPAGSSLQLATWQPATTQGALIGGVLGGVSGALLGALLSNFACIDAEGRCTPPYAKAALLVGLVGGSGGMVIGAGIGSMVVRWKIVYDYRPGFRGRT